MNFKFSFFSEFFNSVKNISNGKANGFRDLVFIKEITGSPFFYKNVQYNAFYYKVPENEFFVIGDNINMSKDSRSFGSIKFRDILGKVVSSIHFYIS
jgi:signal peptidase I